MWKRQSWAEGDLVGRLGLGHLFSHLGKRPPRKLEESLKEFFSMYSQRQEPVRGGKGFLLHE